MLRLVLAVRFVTERWLPATCVGCGRSARDIVCTGCIHSSEVGDAFRLIPEALPLLTSGAFYLAPYAVGGTPTALAQALVRFKYGRDRACGHFLRRLSRQAAPTITSQFDLVVPVPLHRKRLRERGYNQAAWLARALARGLRLPLYPRALTRVRNTAPQAQAGADDRRRGLTDAFQADPRVVSDKRILLVDDVYTTGTTAAEASRALVRAGATDVGAAVLLAALRHR